ncbi:MAG: class I SAM-dependent methyltransferase [Candidatus Pacearchaeota archaeon]|nr:class I SAM-dependent methyltransferase [Candidatus Pacearchaeota archaeon]
MKIRTCYIRTKVDNSKIKVTYDKISKGRPAWIKVDGLPEGSRFISIHLGEKGREGTRIQAYQTYLLENYYLPLNYTKEEMSKYYDQFSKYYDDSLKSTNYNIKAADFLMGKLKKYIKKGELLDLGAGTGLITEMFVKEGFSPATLVDYSPGMLNKAKKRKTLKGCEFVKADIRKLNLHKKFDLILSFFSFGSSSYFDREELDKILKIAQNHLKGNGIFVVLGHTEVSKFKEYFKPLEMGIYTLDKKMKFYVDYFIGRKKG